MRSDPKIVILGAGPTGLGAAWRLEELGHHSWTLLEASDRLGGLATSIVDDKGFTWDIGGHVLFSHYEYFDRLMDELLPDGWIEHVRESWVWMRERWVPYPLQNNIWRLPEDDLVACLRGLLEVQNGRAPKSPPSNFREWIAQSFGPGLADVFMLPYNSKVWAYDPSRLDVGWMGERVATVDLGRILENVVRRRDDCGWGPNHRFRFPRHGGTGAIWNALATRLTRDRIQIKQQVVAIDPHARTVTCKGHAPIPYDVLITTMPLDDLLRQLVDMPDLTALAGDLVYSSSHIVGVGVEGTIPDALKTKNWIYFPETELPFYRVTVFSNYSPNNVPDISKYWSLMGEVSEVARKARRFVAGRRAGCRRPAAGDRVARAGQDRQSLVSATRTRLSDALRRPRCPARQDRSCAPRPRNLQPRPVRLVEVRGREPGPLAHARR